MMPLRVATIAGDAEIDHAIANATGSTSQHTFGHRTR
jgi:hypothetical protein